MGDTLSDLIITTTKVKDYLHYNNIEQVDVFVFEQVWGSTLLGFGGIGGQSITTAWTHIIHDTSERYHVFFNGVHAYTIENPNDDFRKDIANRCMESVQKAMSKYK